MADQLNPAARRSMLQQRIDVGSMWLAAIAAVTLANLVLALLGSSLRLFVGLMSARSFLAAMKQAGPNQYVIGTFTALLLAGLFVLLWSYAKRGRPWALLTALVLYASDFALTLLAPRPFTVGFQAMGLYFILQGYRAARAILKEPATETNVAQANPGQIAQSAPGWYPDPASEHELRYWDGVAWTDHVHDHPTATDPDSAHASWAGAVEQVLPADAPSVIV